MQIVIAGNPGNLESYLSTFDGDTGTVEAEYGDICVAGSAFTLAHHGSRSGNPAPCLTPAGSLPVVDVIGLSHVDLDSLMGCGVAMGRSWPAAFAAVAAFVDVNGPHRASQAPEWESQERFMQAFWAWSEEHRFYPPRDGSVADATVFVEEALAVLDRILAEDSELLAAGAVWAESVATLNEESFVDLICGGIILRQSETFVNHLYAAPDGTVAQVVVAHNPKQGSVTLSFSDADCDSKLTLDDARRLVEILKPYF